MKKAAIILTVFLGSIPAFTNAQGLTWVLWEKNVVYGPTEGGDGSGKTTWAVLDGHEYKQGCEAAAKGSSDANLEALREGKYGIDRFKRYGSSQLIVIWYRDRSRRIKDWICLPNGTDPRPR